MPIDTLTDYKLWCEKTGNRDITTYAHERNKELEHDNHYGRGEFYESILTLIATDIFDITSEELAALAVFGNVKAPVNKYYLSFWTQDIPDDFISDTLFVAGIEERGPEAVWYAVCTTLVASGDDHAWDLASKLGMTIAERRFIKEKPFSWTMNGGKTSDAALKKIDFLAGSPQAEPGILAHDADHVPEQQSTTDDWLADESDS